MANNFYYATPMFPFSKIFPMGIAMVIFGLFTLALGILDVIYTYTAFVGERCDPTAYLQWECPEVPCDNRSIIFVLVSPGIWCGFFILIAGGILTALMYSSGSTLKTRRDSAGVLTGMVAFPLGPALLAITGVRMYFAYGITYCMDNSFIMADLISFLVPLGFAFTTFIAWIIALAVLVALCRKGRLTLADESDYDYGRNRYDYPRGRRPRDPVYDRRPYVLPERENPYNRSFMRPRPYPPPIPYGRRSEPYLTYPGPYLDRRPGYNQQYWTTKTYDRY